MRRLRVPLVQFSSYFDWQLLQREREREIFTSLTCGNRGPLAGRADALSLSHVQTSLTRLLHHTLFEAAKAALQHPLQDSPEPSAPAAWHVRRPGLRSQHRGRPAPPRRRNAELLHLCTSLHRRACQTPTRAHSWRRTHCLQQRRHRVLRQQPLLPGRDRQEDVEMHSGISLPPEWLTRSETLLDKAERGFTWAALIPRRPVPGKGCVAAPSADAHPVHSPDQRTESPAQRTHRWPGKLSLWLHQTWRRAG